MNPAVKKIQVDDPNAIAFVWEPGNATRYEMVVVRTAPERVSVHVANLGYCAEYPIGAFQLSEEQRVGQPNPNPNLLHITNKLGISDQLLGDTLAVCDAVVWAYERMDRSREIEEHCENR